MSERGLWKLKKVGGEIEVETNVKKMKLYEFQDFLWWRCGWSWMGEDAKGWQKHDKNYISLLTITNYLIIQNHKKKLKKTGKQTLKITVTKNFDWKKIEQSENCKR